MNLILDEGGDTVELLKEFKGSASCGSYVKSLLARVPESNADSNIKLSAREAEILNMVGQGKSDKEIASLLFISLGTVKTHLRNIYRKLDVKRRTQAVNKAKELGLFGGV